MGKILLNEVSYDVYSDVSSDLNILLLGDLHDASSKRLCKLLDYFYDNPPDVVIISGDILHSTKYKTIKNEDDELEDKSSDGKLRLIEFLKILSGLCPVILGLGNHDLYKMDEESEKGYNELLDDNIYPLNNSKICIPELNATFTEFHPEHDVFAPSIQNSGLATVQFCDELVRKIEPPSDSDKTTQIMVSHSPKLLATARSEKYLQTLKISDKAMEICMEASKTLSKYKLGASCHLHSGYASTRTIAQDVLDHPEKYMDNGLWEMFKEYKIDGKLGGVKLFYEKTNMCRGTVYIGDDESKILQLSNGEFYYVPDLKYHKATSYLHIPKVTAIRKIIDENRTPIAISGGVNPLFGLDCGVIEATKLVLKKSV